MYYDDSVVIASNQFTDPCIKLRRVQITHVLLSDDGKIFECEEINPDHVPIAKGA